MKTISNREVVRFAPSPTNQNPNPEERSLHGGGLRTALYNYVIRMQNPDSIFIMRCEDTDEARSNDDCLKCIIRDFEWTGIKFDAGFKIENDKPVQFNNTKIDFGPLRQSQRMDIYNAYVTKLLDQGKAYEKDGAIFFSMPKVDVTFKDEILGELKLPAKDCQDFVIRKSSGMPSFYMAMTCDDASMGVTLVIRGMEHINTCFRQVALINALGCPTPKFAHIPLIMNQDGSKMSKRQSGQQVTVMDFRRDGYIPEALTNYFALLGWNPGNNKEFFTIDEMIQSFRINDVNKTNAKFDYKKMANINASYMRSIDNDKFSKYLIDFCNRFGGTDSSVLLPKLKNKMPQICNIVKPRAKTIKDALHQLNFLITDIKPNQELIEKNILQNNNVEPLRDIISEFSSINDWTKENVLTTINKIIDKHASSISKVSSGIRVCVTGTNVSPPIDETCVALGKFTTIQRMSNVLKELA